MPFEYRLIICDRPLRFREFTHSSSEYFDRDVDEVRRRDYFSVIIVWPFKRA